MPGALIHILLSERSELINILLLVEGKYLWYSVPLSDIFRENSRKVITRLAICRENFH